MKVILGIDIGGSATKIVGLRSDGQPISMLRINAEDPVTALFGSLGNFLVSNHLELTDVARIVLTGVGASYVDKDIYGIPTEKVQEFTAVGVGGLALSEQVQGNLTMLAGSGLFVILNYFGQRFFAFKET